MLKLLQGPEVQMQKARWQNYERSLSNILQIANGNTKWVGSFTVQGAEQDLITAMNVAGQAQRAGTYFKLEHVRPI
jgi:hypothetical protein